MGDKERGRKGDEERDVCEVGGGWRRDVSDWRCVKIWWSGMVAIGAGGCVVHVMHGHVRQE